MTENKVLLLMEKFEGAMTTDQAFDVRNLIVEADDAEFGYLIDMPLKKKGVALALSIFLGIVAAGRFYIGDVGLAVAKILFSILMAVMISVPVLGTVLGIICFIWNISDMFLCYKKCKKKNFERVCRVLNSNANAEV